MCKYRCVQLHLKNAKICNLVTLKSSWKNQRFQKLQLRHLVLEIFLTFFLKLVVSAIFYQIFIFSPSYSPSKTIKNCYFTWKVLFVGNFLNLFCKLKSNGHQFQAPFVFDNFVHKKGLGSKEKIRLIFLRLFDNPLLKYLVFKIISCI